MSAETIPNEAMAWEYDTQIFDGSWHSVVTREHPDILGNTYRNLQPLTADRSTRPAKPAAPVAEAGDGEVERRWIGQRAGQPAKATRMERVAEIWRDQGLIVTEWVPLSTLEAERARADAAEQRATDALARAEKAAEDERDRLFQAWMDRAPPAHGVTWSDVIFWFRDEQASMPPPDRARLRAAREAQPATDGGDNG